MELEVVVVDDVLTQEEHQEKGQVEGSQRKRTKWNNYIIFIESGAAERAAK